jgi:biotin operon repressor
MIGRMETVRKRVLEALRLATRPLDDDELARRLDVRPRQTVNKAARKLEADGLLRRVSGPDGKRVNVLVGDAEVPAPVVVELATGHEPPPGDSSAQRAAERLMLDALGRDLGGLILEPARIVIDDVRVEVDGADAERTVLVECWAHQGTVKAAQRNKVMTDALKLTWVASRLPVPPRLILCMSDPVAAAPFTTALSWAATAFRDLGIEVRVVSLTDETRQGVQDAQTRQYR